jgi:hypothetical protein
MNNLIKKLNILLLFYIKPYFFLNTIPNTIFYTHGVFNKNKICLYSIILPDPKECKNCKHFTPNNIQFRSESMNNNIGFCNKFTMNNPITGDEYKLFTYICLKNENLCGENGKHYRFFIIFYYF